MKDFTKRGDYHLSCRVCDILTLKIARLWLQSVLNVILRHSEASYKKKQMNHDFWTFLVLQKLKTLTQTALRQKRRLWEKTRLWDQWNLTTIIFFKTHGFWRIVSVLPLLIISKLPLISWTFMTVFFRKEWCFWKETIVLVKSVGGKYCNTLQNNTGMVYNYIWLCSLWG